MEDFASSAGEFQALSSAFSARVSELRRFCHLRVDDTAQAACQQELVGLEASIKALEAHVADIRAYLQRENTTIPKVEALLAACSLQSDDIASMAATASTAASTQQKAQAAPQVLANVSNRQGEERRKREAPAVPRWYVTQQELDAVSSYMKGRLSVEKVNAAVDEMAGHAEATGRLLLAAQNSGQKLTTSERKKATELLHSVAGREGVRGRPWFLESSLKDGQVLRLDKSSKALLVLLRHLGRLQEVRCAMEGAPCLVYVLCQA